MLNPGKGAKVKGNLFENNICRALSLWITEQKHKTLFRRAILSGGAFTNAAKKPTPEELGIAGDIAAAHPLAFEFLSLFCIECKHHKDIRLDTYMFDYKNTSFLSKTISKVQRESVQSGTNWMVIARQNNQPTLLFMDARSGRAAILASNSQLVHYHFIRAETIMLVTFAHFMATVLPAEFLSRVKHPTGLHVPIQRVRRSTGIIRHVYVEG